VADTVADYGGWTADTAADRHDMVEGVLRSRALRG
jgi:hypothetical protein